MGQIVPPPWCTMLLGPTKKSFVGFSRISARNVLEQAALLTIGERIRAQGITKTAIFLVGLALARPTLHVSKLYDKEFGHGYRPGTSP